MASIEERASGIRVTWRLRRPGHPDHGMRRPLECHDIETAEKVKGIVEAHRGNITREELGRMLWPDQPDESNDITFRELADLWLPTKTRISPRTRDGYRGRLNFRILPAFGDKLVGAFRPTDVSNFVIQMRDAGLSNATITRHYTVINQAFAFAVKNGYRDTNPCDDTDFVWDQVADDDQGDEKHVYLTDNEYLHLHGSMAAAIVQDVVEVAAGTGCRYSEYTAIQPRDLIPPTRRNPEPQLWVRRAWKLRKDANGRREWYLGTTKGRQQRKITVDWSLWELLLELSENKKPDDLLLTDPDGGRIDYDWFEIRWNAGVARAMRCRRHPPAMRGQRIADAVGTCGDNGGLTDPGEKCGHKLKPGWNRCTWHIPAARGAVSDCDCRDVLHRRPTPHDLRHSCAAWMIADPNLSMTYASRHLGHAGTWVTDKVYGGVLPSGQKTAASAIAKGRGRATSARPPRRPAVSSGGPMAEAGAPGETAPGPRRRRQPAPPPAA